MICGGRGTRVNGSTMIDTAHMARDAEASAGDRMSQKAAQRSGVRRRSWSQGCLGEAEGRSSPEEAGGRRSSGEAGGRRSPEEAGRRRSSGEAGGRSSPEEPGGRRSRARRHPLLAMAFTDCSTTWMARQTLLPVNLIFTKPPVAKNSGGSASQIKD